MIVSINQPAYLPWLGYFQRIAASDIHVVLDNVQFEKNSMVNRNKIRSPQGFIMLTVPIKTKGRFGNLRIMDMEIAHDSWRKKHVGALKANYARAPFFNDYMPQIEEILSKRWASFAPLAKTMTEFFLDTLGLERKIVLASSLSSSSKKSDLILDICLELKADTYLSGPFGKNYLTMGDFENHNIKLHYQNYEHPVYDQVWPGFEPSMSIIDLLFNHGTDSLSILCTNQKNCF